MLFILLTLTRFPLRQTFLTSHHNALYTNVITAPHIQKMEKDNNPSVGGNPSGSSGVGGIIANNVYDIDKYTDDYSGETEGPKTARTTMSAVA